MYIYATRYALSYTQHQSSVATSQRRNKEGMNVSDHQMMQRDHTRSHYSQKSRNTRHEYIAISNLQPTATATVIYVSYLYLGLF